MKTNSQRFHTSRALGTPIGFALLLLAISPRSVVAQSNTFPSSGNAGIGTTSPSAPLTITTDGNTVDGTYYSTVTVRKTGNTYTGFRFDKNSTALFRLGTDPTNNFHISRLTGPGSPDDGAFYLTQSGNVGIGTMSPVFDVNTARYLTIDAGSAGGGNSIGSFGAGGNVGSSAVLGQYAFLNTGLGTTDKRVATIVGLTNGETNTGRIDFYATNAGSFGPPTMSVASSNVSVTGNMSVSGNINAKYQDVAEWVPSSEQLTAGTVVVVDQTKSNQVVASSMAYDTRVAGVISAQPGITLGEKSDGKVLVATTGRVRVKVDASRGPIAMGDLLVTSDVAGVAMKSEAVNLGGVQIHRPGTIIGKALEPLAKGKGEILVLLGLQ